MGVIEGVSLEVHCTFLFIVVWLPYIGYTTCFRFGSIIAGALQSNLFAKRNKTGETKVAQRKNKPKRGSFSFQGGMQVLNHCANISPFRKILLCA